MLASSQDLTATRAEVSARESESRSPWASAPSIRRLPSLFTRLLEATDRAHHLHNATRESCVKSPGESLARVVSVGQNAVWVALEGSEELQLAALPKGRIRLHLAPGDLVHSQPLDDGRVLVQRREPRSFALTRRTGGGRLKTMAANIDGIGIVAALANPPFHGPMVDELLAFARLHEIAALLVLTKPDLADDASREAIPAL